jgi:hypothetical protein
MVACNADRVVYLDAVISGSTHKKRQRLKEQVAMRGEEIEMTRVEVFFEESPKESDVDFFRQDGPSPRTGPYHWYLLRNAFHSSIVNSVGFSALF